MFLRLRLTLLLPENRAGINILLSYCSDAVFYLPGLLCRSFTVLLRGSGAQVCNTKSND